MKYISSSYLAPLVPVGHEEITKTAFSSVGQALVGVARAVDLAWTLFLGGWFVNKDIIRLL